MSAPDDKDYEEVVVTDITAWFKSGREYQATLVPPDHHVMDDVALRITVYPIDSRLTPAITELLLSETEGVSITPRIQRYPLNRPAKQVPTAPSDHTVETPEYESSVGLDPAPQ